MKTTTIEETIRLDKDTEYLTPKQFADLFPGMTEDYVQGLCRKNKIEHVRVERRYWIPRSAIEKFLVTNG